MFRSSPLPRLRDLWARQSALPVAVAYRSGVGAAWSWEAADGRRGLALASGCLSRVELVLAALTDMRRVLGRRRLRLVVASDRFASELAPLLPSRVVLSVDADWVERLRLVLSQDPAVKAAAAATIRLACDGAYNHEQGAGSWSFETDGGLSGAGVVPADTDSQRCELLAAVEALRALPEGSSVLLLSDNRLVVRGIAELSRTGVLPDWPHLARPSYRRLWEELALLCRSRRVTPRWVRGHAGHRLQCRVDRRARRVLRAHLQRVAAASAPAAVLPAS